MGKPMTDFARQRAAMVASQITPNDVSDPRIQQAAGDIPRELFVPEAKRPLAYMSECIEIAPGRWLMDPRSFGKLLQLADISETDTVLDIGCGTGYSSAVIARLAKHVYALEEDRDLAARATRLMKELDVANLTVVTGTLTQGHAANAPYDVIVMEGAIEHIPDAISAQMKDGGKLVAIVGAGPVGKGQLWIKSGAGMSHRIAFDATIPLLPGFARAHGFVF